MKRTVKKKRRAIPKPVMPKDLEILKFLWKWKLSTGLVLFHATASGDSARAFNKRLAKLELNGVIEQTGDPIHARKLWELTPLGLEQINSRLPELVDNGIKSASMDHDFMCLALLLGEWPFERGEKPEIITDQELLRVHEDSWPEWRPKIAHRADGYLKIPTTTSGNNCIAFEAELSVKRFWKYREAISAYNSPNKIQRVVWLYRDPYFLSQFMKAKADVKDESMNFHVFVSEEDYMRDGWNAWLSNERSEKLLTFRELLRGKGGVDTGEIAANGGMIPKIGIFADRKKYVNLKKTYVPTRNPENV